MLFKRCSIDGQLFADVNDHLVCENSGAVSSNERSVRRFLEVLALCHTVQVAPKRLTKSTRNLKGSLKVPEEVSYNASSPDEKAIVEACRNYGVAFMGETELQEGQLYSKLAIDNNSTKKYQKLQVLEFDSDRKCMSVLVKDQKGVIRLLTKGAESSVLPKCLNNTQTTGQHINQFATQGLRTLAVAVRVLTDEEYQDFASAYAQASQSLKDRQAKVSQVYQDLETNLELIGAIGVEDQLQEGVGETLVALGQAGVKVWILTGDKKETAINISRSCGHFRANMHLIDITGLTNPQHAETVLNQKLNELSRQRSEQCLIVDGTTLASIFLPTNKGETQPLLRLLAQECASVICCRMSPLQKAEIVAMMKNHQSKPVTAAVGDGANDVAMIQEAHVGLGIMGKEGRAAVRSADFAFAKFKHLKR